MLVSVIVPVHNGAMTLPACLRACEAQTHRDIEVIVVDDASTDATPNVARAFGVHYIRLDEQQGPAAARNRGAEAAKGAFLAFTDADCVPDEHWIEQLLAKFDEETVAVGGTYVPVSRTSLLAEMIQEEVDIRHEQYADEVDYLGSFNVAYRKTAFEETGGFDESFRAASGEDNDLAYRLHDQAGKLRFNPAAIVAHHHPRKLWPYLRTQARHGFWRMKLYAKHPRRAKRGDQYAGISDLLGPPLSLLAVACVPLAIWASFVPRWFPPVAFVAAPIFLAYGLLHLDLRIKMVRRTRDRRMYAFGYVLLLRDLARALGMMGGIAYFILLRRGRS